MKERPILFSAPMVRAILAGKKTQTRRVIRVGEFQTLAFENGHIVRGDLYGLHPVKPYAQVGDRLWVRETFGPSVDWPEALTLPEYEGGHDPDRLLYRADEPRNLTQHYGIPWDRVKWKPSIFMPRWASRITLEVTDVRVGRLQDISEGDVWAEGAISHVARHTFNKIYRDNDERTAKARELFRDLWNSINAKRAPWASNPWVWVVEFRRVRP